MGGRGGSSGMVSHGDGYNYAQELANAKVKDASLREFKKDLAFDLKYYKEHGEVRDNNLVYQVIYKNGDQKFFGEQESDSSIRSIKTSNIAYMSVSSGDGFDDSIGFHSYTDRGKSIINNPVEFENYQSEVERIFGTSWGKRHPRRER